MITPTRSRTTTATRDSKFLFDSDFPDHLVDHHRPPLDSQPSQPMPHRVDSNQSLQRRDSGNYDHYRRPSPPPIATLPQSPSHSASSLDRSSVASPPPPLRRSPPHHHLSSSYSNHSYYSQNNQLPSMSDHRDSLAARDHARAHPYSPRPSYDHRRDSADSHLPSYQNSSTYQNSQSSIPSMSNNSINSSFLLPGQANQGIAYTSDAQTKVNDHVRRRCFNCCSTDTSTWRRSNLNPGKVLCNRCGLYERTHSTARPDQFPHRRGPMAPNSLRRTPPGQQLPSLSGSAHSLAPYHYQHPSIAPLTSVPDTRRPYNPNTLPEIQSWLSAPTSSIASTSPPTARRDIRNETA